MVCKLIKRGLCGWSQLIQESSEMRSIGRALRQAALLPHGYNCLCSKEVVDSKRSVGKTAKTSFPACAFKRIRALLHHGETLSLGVQRDNGK